MRAFLDTSAIAKRYVAEQGADKVAALCGQADSLVVSVICLPELISTLSRLVRENRLGDADYQALKQHALDDFADMDVCQLTPTVLGAVIPLLESNTLRAMDALHVACALAAGADMFASADHRQLAAAQKAGLMVLDVS